MYEERPIMYEERQTTYGELGETKGKQYTRHINYLFSKFVSNIAYRGHPCQVDINKD